MENLIITTPDVSNVTLSPKTGWFMINVAGYQIATADRAEDIVLADLSSPFNFGTFSDESFEEFEKKVIGTTSLFSSDLFPIGTYGIDLGGTPHKILESITLTNIQKSVMTLAINCQRAGYYVVVATTDDQVVFRNFLRTYNISTATIRDIQRIVE
ncbi:MAG: hypothetical protein AB1643_02505 [Patescibacteria group bacterium]